MRMVSNMVSNTCINKGPCTCVNRGGAYTCGGEGVNKERHKGDAVQMCAIHRCEQGEKAIRAFRGVSRRFARFELLSYRFAQPR